MQLADTSYTENYSSFLNYLFGYYFTADHKYGIMNQDHFTDMLNGDMDGTNNTSETINRGLKKFSSCGAKNLKSVFRTIYNFKFDCNKRIANKVKMRKRKTATSVKYSKILEILSEFENMSADEHIINLCTTLERLGSL